MKEKLPGVETHGKAFDLLDAKGLNEKLTFGEDEKIMVLFMGGSHGNFSDAEIIKSFDVIRKAVGRDFYMIFTLDFN